MYADTFLSREEFEEMFDLTAYEQVRKKYHAEGTYDKLVWICPYMPLGALE